MKKESPPPSTTAPRVSRQGGYRHSDRVEIKIETLSFREQKVLNVLRAATAPMTVKSLAGRCFPGFRAKKGTYETTKADGTTTRRGTAPAYRCVLNCLRRLVVGSFVKKVGRGTYEAIATLPTSQP